MEHKMYVEEIMNLKWSDCDPLSIVIMSAFTAQEFATSLRCALEPFGDDPAVVEMSVGELMTDNLQFDTYQRVGDHADFLWFFLGKMDRSTVEATKQRIESGWLKYNSIVEAMTNRERAMTIFSREQELPDIFREILASHDWCSEDYGFYRYYLERHIDLDSQANGHGDLVRRHILDERVLRRFYQARLAFYQETIG